MANTELKQRISNAVKDAMRAKQKERLSALRLIMAEFKRIEVDERIDVDDARVLVVLDGMLKQRRDSFKQYQDAGRDELAAQEQFEIELISEFLPPALSDDELEVIVQQAVETTGASSIKDMGKVMGIIKPQVQGRADMGAVGALVKAKLG